MELEVKICLEQGRSEMEGRGWGLRIQSPRPNTCTSFVAQYPAGGTERL